MGRVVAQPIETIELVDTGITEVITDLLLIGKLGLTTETEISNPKFVTPEQFTYLHDTIAGQASANKAMILDSSLNIRGINDISLNNNIHKYSSNEVRSIEKTSTENNNDGRIIILPDINNLEKGMYLIEQSFNDLGGRTLPTIITEVYENTDDTVIEISSIEENDIGNEIILPENSISDIKVGMFLKEVSITYDGRSYPTQVTSVNLRTRTVKVESKSSSSTPSGTTYTFKKLNYVIVEESSGVRAPSGTVYTFSKLGNQLNYYKSRDLHPDSYAYENVRADDILGQINFYGNSSAYDHKYICSSSIQSTMTNTPYKLTDNIIVPSEISFSTIDRNEGGSKVKRVSIDSPGNLNIHGKKELRLLNDDGEYVGISASNNMSQPYRIEMPTNPGSTGELLKITEHSILNDQDLPKAEVGIIPEIIYELDEDTINKAGDILILNDPNQDITEGMYLVDVRYSNGVFATNWNENILPSQVKRVIRNASTITVVLENSSTADSVGGLTYSFRDSVKSRITVQTQFIGGSYVVNHQNETDIRVNDSTGIEEGMYLVECSNQTIYNGITGLEIRVMGIENNAVNNTHIIKLETPSSAATDEGDSTKYTFAYGQVSGFTGLIGSTNSDGSKTFTFTSPIGSGFSQENPPEVNVIGSCKSKAIIKANINGSGSIENFQLIDGGSGYLLAPNKDIKVQENIKVGWGGVDNNVVGRGENGSNANTITITSIDDNKTIQVGMFLFYQTDDHRSGSGNTLLESGGALVTNVSGTLPTLIITIDGPSSGSTASPSGTIYKFTSQGSGTYGISAGTGLNGGGTKTTISGQSIDIGLDFFELTEVSTINSNDQLIIYDGNSIPKRKNIDSLAEILNGTGLTAELGILNVNPSLELNELTSGLLKIKTTNKDGELRITNNYSLTERIGADENIESIDIDVRPVVVDITGNITVTSTSCSFNTSDTEYTVGSIEEDMYLVDIGLNSMKDITNPSTYISKKLPTRVSVVSETGSTITITLDSRLNDISTTLNTTSLTFVNKESLSYYDIINIKGSHSGGTTITVTEPATNHGITDDMFLIYEGGPRSGRAVMLRGRNDDAEIKGTPINITAINGNTITVREPEATSGTNIHYQFARLRIAGETQLKTNNEKYLELSKQETKLDGGSIVKVNIINRGVYSNNIHAVHLTESLIFDKPRRSGGIIENEEGETAAGYIKWRAINNDYEVSEIVITNSGSGYECTQTSNSGSIFATVRLGLGEGTDSNRTTIPTFEVVVSSENTFTGKIGSKTPNTGRFTTIDITKRINYPDTDSYYISETNGNTFAQTANHNTVLGHNTFIRGNSNTYLGNRTGPQSSQYDSASYNTCIGHLSGSDLDSVVTSKGQKNTFIGYKSGENIKGNNNIFIGSFSTDDTDYVFKEEDVETPSELNGFESIGGTGHPYKYKKGYSGDESNNGEWNNMLLIGSDVNGTQEDKYIIGNMNPYDYTVRRFTIYSKVIIGGLNSDPEVVDGYRDLRVNGDITSHSYKFDSDVYNTEFGYRQNTLLSTAKYNIHIGYKAQELFSSSFSENSDGNSSHNILIGSVDGGSSTTTTTKHHNILIGYNFNLTHSFSLQGVTEPSTGVNFLAISPNDTSGSLIEGYHDGTNSNSWVGINGNLIAKKEIVADEDIYVGQTIKLNKTNGTIQLYDSSGSTDSSPTTILSAVEVDDESLGNLQNINDITLENDLTVKNNASITGTLDVTLATTLSSTLNVTADTSTFKEVTVNENLTVDGLVELKTSGLNKVHGKVLFYDEIKIGSSLSTNNSSTTNISTIDSSGNILLTGTLTSNEIVGAIGTNTQNSGKFSSLQSTGILNISGATTLSSTLNVTSGTSTFKQVTVNDSLTSTQLIGSIGTNTPYTGRFTQLTLTEENSITFEFDSSSVGKENLYFGFNAGKNVTLNTNSSNVLIKEYVNGTYQIISDLSISNYNYSPSGGGKNNVFIGYSSGEGLSSYQGMENTCVGTRSGYELSGSGNTLVGYRSGYNVAGISNTFIGSYSGKSNTNGNFNTFIGRECGESNAQSSHNTFIGYRCAKNNIRGHDNIIIGSQSAESFNNGVGNVFIGNNVSKGETSSTGNYDVIIGKDAHRLIVSSERNVIIGYRSGYNNSNGTSNVFLGYQSGYTSVNGGNVFVGDMSGYHFRQDNNICIGKSSGPSSSSETDYNICIGVNSGPSTNSLTLSNKLYIHSGTTKKGIDSLIYGDFLTQEVTINGKLNIRNKESAYSGEIFLYGSLLSGGKKVKITTPLSIPSDYNLILPPNHGSPNQVLTTNGSGTLTWNTVGTGNVQVASIQLTAGNSVLSTDLDNNKLTVVHASSTVKGVASYSSTNFVVVEGSSSEILENRSNEVQIKTEGILTGNLASNSVTLEKMADITSGSLIVGKNSEPFYLDASTSGNILIGDGTDLQSKAMSGDATIDGNGELTITDTSVSLGKMATIPSGSLIVGSSSGNTYFDAKTSGNIVIGNGTEVRSKAMSGDATINGEGVLSISSQVIQNDNIDNNTIEYSKIQNIVSAERVLGSHSAGGDVVEVQVSTGMLQDTSVTLGKMADINSGSLIVGSSSGNTYLDAKTSGNIVIGNGTGIQSKAISGDATINGDGVLSIESGKIDTNHLSDSSVTTTKIASNAVQLGSQTSGNYVSTLTGTADEVSVSGQTGDITVGLEDDIKVNSVGLKQGDKTVTIHPPDTLSANYTIKLPEDDGEDKTSLITNGSGITSWGKLPGTILNYKNYSPSSGTDLFSLTSQMANIFNGSIKTTFTPTSSLVLVSFTVYNRVSSFSDRTTLYLGLSGNSNSGTYSEWSSDYSETNNQNTRRIITNNSNTSGTRTCEWILNVSSGSTYHINVAASSSVTSHSLAAGFLGNTPYPPCILKISVL